MRHCFNPEPTHLEEVGAAAVRSTSTCRTRPRTFRLHRCGYAALGEQDVGNGSYVPCLLHALYRGLHAEWAEKRVPAPEKMAAQEWSK